MINRLKAWLYFEWQIYKVKIKPYLTWTMLPSMILAWLITNTWLYLFIWLAIKIQTPFMITLSGVITAIYLSAPEKFITIPLGFYIQRKLFIRRAKYENFKYTKKCKSMGKIT